MCVPFYLPHAFVPKPAKPGYCEYCHQKLGLHPYWEEERATAAAAIVRAAGDLRHLDPAST